MSSVILLGTSRPDGNTHTLAKQVARQLACKIYNLADYEISPFDYEHKNSGDDFLKLFQELIVYEHIILATPVYWYSPSAQMKIFLDRISDLLTIEKDLGRLLRGKSLSTISTGVELKAPGCFNEVFKRTASYLGMEYVGALYGCCADNLSLKENTAMVEAYVARVKE